MYELGLDGSLIKDDRTSPQPFLENYGSILNTLAGDGDPVDVIICGGALTIGSEVIVRPIGVLYMVDREEPDEKVVAVIANDPMSEAIKDVDDITGLSRSAIEQFLSDFKLAFGHEITFNGWGDNEAADKLIEAAYQRYGVNA